jgi:NADH-quinone oxidoreductase subunit D
MSATTSDQDLFSGPGEEPAEGTVYTVMGGDWDGVVTEQGDRGDERIVVNMGPQHPSTHGVLRLILELDGETVTELRSSIGHLHTGIEKNMEYRTWTQGVTFITRADYVMPLHNELAYVLSVEKLLGIEDEITERTKIIRVMMVEWMRIASHLVALGTGGMELGATTLMTVAFREREKIMDVFETITGLRMNHAYIRPGGVAQDLPANGIQLLKDTLKSIKKQMPEFGKLANANPIVKSRLVGVGYLDLTACMALGVTGPLLRAAGYDYDLRKAMPYSDYETYEFDVPVRDEADAYARFRNRVDEMWESVRIIDQCVRRLEETQGQRVMVDDPKIAWPAQLSIGSDGQGNSNEHLKHIMGQSMEALIHHFKLVTEGFRVPPGQAYVPTESAKGELGAHVVSDGGTRPFRVHLRDPSFHQLQALPALCEGGMIADVVVNIATIDPVLGGVDR